MKISDEAYLEAALNIFTEIKGGIYHPSDGVNHGDRVTAEYVADKYAEYVAIIASRLKSDLSAK